AESSSLVEDISIGDVVKIKSVASSASATTDGVKASGTAATTVSGMTIAGQTATIDDQGLHIGAQGQPANAIANQIAAQALSKSGMQIVLSAPTKEVNGGAASMTAGSLVVAWNAGQSVFTVTFG